MIMSFSVFLWQQCKDHKFTDTYRIVLYFLEWDTVWQSLRTLFAILLFFSQSINLRGGIQRVFLV